MVILYLFCDSYGLGVIDFGRLFGVRLDRCANDWEENRKNGTIRLMGVFLFCRFRFAKLRMDSLLETSFAISKKVSSGSNKSDNGRTFILCSQWSPSAY